MKKVKMTLLLLPILMIGSGLTSVSQNNGKYTIDSEQLKQIRLLEADERQCQEMLVLCNTQIDTMKREIIVLKGMNLQLEKQNELNFQIISEQNTQFNSCKKQKEYYLNETIRLNRSGTRKNITILTSLTANFIFLILILK